MATIRKRGSKYQVQVRRQGSPNISRSFILLSDAKAWARLEEARADRGELVAPRRDLAGTTLGCLVRRYLNEVVPTKRGRRDETIMLTAFLRHPICKRPVLSVGVADFARYRDDRLGEVTPATVRRQLNPVRHLFEIAREEWEMPLASNPVAQLKLRVTDDRRERRLTEREKERLLIAAERQRNPVVVQVVHFALETAMRRGEILSLRWEQVDFGRQCVKVLTTKNGFARSVPLTHDAVALLRGIRRDCAEAVFPITGNAVRLAWERIRTHAECPDVRFHDLRHEAISRFFEMGLTVPEVASISGHRDLKSLSRYAHAGISEIRRKFDEI